MCAIRDFVRATSLPETLKEELAGDFVLQQHALYVQLPAWLAPVFGVGPVQVEQLSFSSYFYFRFLLVVDHVLDAAPVLPPAPPLPPTAAAVAGNQLATQRLLVYCDLYERAVRGLSDLFPTGDPFWAQLDACKKQYVAGTLLEKAMNVGPRDFSRESFEALAAGKSAVCNAVVHALACLGGTTEPVAPLLECLRHVHVALQCLDDVEDFRTDWEQGQYTYAHAQVEAYLEAQGLAPRVLTGAQVHPYLYTSGTADALFALAQEHFGRALALAGPFQLTGLRNLVSHHIARCGFYRTDIEAKLAAARHRVQQPVVA